MPGQQKALFGVQLLPFRVPHQERDISFGYRVETADRALLYSGDCGWNEDLVRYSHGTDLFICECCYFQTKTSFHINYPTIVQEQHRLGCRRLLLSHIGREVLERQGEVSLECAHDGMVIEV